MALIDDPTAVTTVRRDWLADEAATRGVGRELARLFRRARRRWLRTVACALLCAALAVIAAARRPPRFESSVVFRVAEPADARLREHVVAIVFSRTHLYSVIQANGLYPSLAARDPAQAVERMREDLTVELRAGYLRVTFRGEDADKVYATVAHLGRLVGESEQRARAVALIDPGHRDESGLSRPALLGWLTLFSFLFALPLCAIAVGAFDPRVYELDDVRRLGLPAVGAVRAFEGDNGGALDARLRSDGRARIAEW